MQSILQKKPTSFQEHGYLLVRNAFSREQLSGFKDALLKLIDFFLEKAFRDNKCNKLSLHTCDEKIIALNNIDPSYISMIQRIISRTPEFFSLTSCIATMPLMRSLYGLEDKSPIYILNNGIVFTCPNDRNNEAVSNFETDWHNDVFYTIPKSRFWQVWVPLLHDATTEIGTLMVCAGSHKNGIGEQRINIHANYNHRYTIAPETLSQYSPESVEVNLGDMLIFDSKLIHKSGLNTSNLVRCTMLGSYHDASSEDFSPVGFEYKYYGKTPESYYYELFGDDDAKKIMFDSAAVLNLPQKTGV